MNGLEFKKIRKELNLTQESVAKTLGLARKTISSYENSEEIPQAISIAMRKMRDNVTFELQEPDEPYHSKKPNTCPTNDLNHCKELLEVKNELIEALKNRIDDLLKTIASKETEIKSLKKSISELD